MRSTTPYWAVILFSASSVLAIYSGFANAVRDSLRFVQEQDKIHYAILLFFIGTCLYRIIDGQRLATRRKITQFDFICLTVHNCFALIQLASCAILYYLESENQFFQAAIVLRDWSLFPFFLWIFAWSRFIRRGW